MDFDGEGKEREKDRLGGVLDSDVAIIRCYYYASGGVNSDFKKNAHLECSLSLPFSYV